MVTVAIIGFDYFTNKVAKVNGVPIYWLAKVLCLYWLYQYTLRYKFKVESQISQLCISNIFVVQQYLVLYLRSTKSEKFNQYMDSEWKFKEKCW